MPLTTRPPRPVREVDPGRPVAELTALLSEALDGGRALLPRGAAPEPPNTVDHDTALLLPTSGSTGNPKLVRLPADALLASARATHERVGPPGRWLLALPLGHVAGWQVLVRGLLAAPDSRIPVSYPGDRAFTSAGFLACLDDAPGPAPEYVSLVPTQLTRLLEDPTSTSRLTSMTVLLGGAAAADSLLDRARQAGVRVVTTYGSTETSGGCVYDGQPLSGVQTRILPDGRLMLGGHTIASGYLDDDNYPASAFSRDASGTRWFTTSDLAEQQPDGRLRILGRADDVIVTGGEKVAPAAVERVLAQLPGVGDILVVGVPDPEWGEQVTVLTTRADPDMAAWRRHVRERIADYAAPREVLVVAEIPLRGIGKPDRAAARALAIRLSRQPGRP